MDFSDCSFNRENFVATMQLLGKGDATLQEHLFLRQTCEV